MVSEVHAAVSKRASTPQRKAPARSGKPSAKQTVKSTNKVSKQVSKGVSKGASKGSTKSVQRRPRGPNRVVHERPVPWMKGNLPNVQAFASLVVDLETGEEFFSRHSDTERPIASISKLAATLVVVERGLDLDALTTMSRIDAEVARGGAPSRLLEGMTVSNRDLLHAALLGSDNRAVSAMGRAVNLSASALAAEMTKRASSLGLKHTRFREPTGLSPENVSTPREIIALLRTAMANPTLATVLRRMEYDAHPVSRPPIHYVSTYRPAARSNAEILGGKTGYNDFARYCLVVAARVDGHRFGMAFLGSEGKLTRFGDFGRVADWLVARKPKGTPGTALASAPAAPNQGSAPVDKTAPGPMQEPVVEPPAAATLIPPAPDEPAPAAVLAGPGAAPSSL